ncbi:MAG: hypothetical protein OXI74_14305 [Rhodospirillaceae bacterium]|nr:hypothetical protein [Rhodospirillaceae bacterium]
MSALIRDEAASCAQRGAANASVITIKQAVLWRYASSTEQSFLAFRGHAKTTHHVVTKQYGHGLRIGNNLNLKNYLGIEAFRSLLDAIDLSLCSDREVSRRKPAANVE